MPDFWRKSTTVAFLKHQQYHSPQTGVSPNVCQDHCSNSFRPFTLERWNLGVSSCSAWDAPRWVEGRRLMGQQLLWRDQKPVINGVITLHLGFTWGGLRWEIEFLNPGGPVDQNKVFFFFVFKDDPNVKRFPWAKSWSFLDFLGKDHPSKRSGKVMVIDNQQQTGLKWWFAQHHRFI